MTAFVHWSENNMLNMLRDAIIGNMSRTAPSVQDQLFQVMTRVKPCFTMLYELLEEARSTSYHSVD